MGICLGKETTAAADGAGGGGGGQADQNTGHGTLGGMFTDHQTHFHVRDHFVSAVETMGVSAQRTYGTLFGAGGGGGESNATRSKLDEAFKKRVNEAKEGVARLKVVFADPLNLAADYKAPVHEKTKEETEFINKCLTGAFLFDKLESREKKTLVDAFEKHSVEGGQTIIKQGDIGDFFYIIQRGKVKYLVDGEEVGKAGRGDFFGELALLYNSPRAATVISLHSCELWRVDQMTFRRILASYQIREDSETKALLKNVDFLKDLDDAGLTKIAYLMGTKKVKAGEHVFKKGEETAHFIIVKSGKLKAADIEIEGKTYPDREFGRGGHIGAQAVLKRTKFVANVTAVDDTEVLYLEKDAFIRTCGDYEELITKSSDSKALQLLDIAKIKLDESTAGHLASVMVTVKYKKGHVFYREGDDVQPALYVVRSGKVTVENSADGCKTVGVFGFFGEETVEETLDDDGNTVVSRHTVTVLEDVTVGYLGVQSIRHVLGPGSKRKGDVKMEDLERHRILGAGTFGQVWLVNRKGTKDAYALKIQFKRQLIDSNQAAGVIREKNIMAKLHSDFIIKLVGSYQDKENVYMLMKLYQGGELWSVMHGGDGDALPELAAKFYMASVLEGLTYMHRRHVLYRDLKPENVLLDSDGYTVIVDLGFAKVVMDKTYTFCGTPLYLAPEVILQRGHDKGADHWSWGVMLYEMICGITPFYDKNIDQMTLFKRIINSRYHFPIGDFITEDAKDLIKSILVVDPNARLGSFARAEKDIQEHAWFRGVNFEKLRKRQLTPPWQPEITDPLDVTNFDNWDHLKDKKREGKPLTKKEQELFKDF